MMPVLPPRPFNAPVISSGGKADAAAVPCPAPPAASKMTNKAPVSTSADSKAGAAAAHKAAALAAAKTRNGGLKNK